MITPPQCDPETLPHNVVLQLFQQCDPETFPRNCANKPKFKKTFGISFSFSFSFSFSSIEKFFWLLRNFCRSAKMVNYLCIVIVISFFFSIFVDSCYINDCPLMFKRPRRAESYFPSMAATHEVNYHSLPQLLRFRVN